MPVTERYDEQSVSDLPNNLRILRGSALDDSTLALLRAFYMKKTLEEKLRSLSPRSPSVDALRWVLRSAALPLNSSQQSSASIRTVEVEVLDE